MPYSSDVFIRPRTCEGYTFTSWPCTGTKNCFSFSVCWNRHSRWYIGTVLAQATRYFQCQKCRCHSNQHDRFSPKQCVIQHVSEEAINSTSTGIPRGHMNLGNTCFANSICQALFSVADLQPLFDQNYPISVTLNVLKSEIYECEQMPVCPDYLFALPQFARWPRNDQQDAHDFLLWLLQKLHTEHVLHGSCDVSWEGIGHTTSMLHSIGLGNS